MIEIAADVELDIGEGLVWDEGRQWLWFVDILACRLYALEPATRELRRFVMPASIGSVGVCRDGRLVVALRNGVHLYDPADGSLALLVHPEPARTENRLNDGKVGPDGAFWMGSMSEAQPFEPTGSFYRIAADGSCRTVLTDLYVSNGLGWSPDGRTMYHADTVPGLVSRYAFDPATGEIGASAPFAKLIDEGRPDGAAVDRDGRYWSAGVTAGRLNCVDADGTPVRSIELPCPAPTMACFAGPELRDLYVTSLARDGQPGRLYRLTVEAQGLPSYLFG